MVRASALILAIGISSLPTATLANWQYTKWGMTEAQVAAKVPGGTRPSKAFDGNGDSEQPKIEGGHTANGRQFTATFYFSASGGLSRVSLTPIELGECLKIIDDLLVAFGEPSVKKRGSWITHDFQWSVPSSGVRVEAMRVATGLKTTNCRITYRPLASPSAQGY